MVSMLVGLHAVVAEIGLFAFIWVFVELLNPTEVRIKRAKIASIIGVSFLVLSWFVGGAYYVGDYGTDVKPVIKSGDAAWTHGIAMEVKEHVFLFLPILAIVTSLLIFRYDNEIIRKEGEKIAIDLLAGLIFLMGFAMAGLGIMISMGFRYTLELGII